MLKKILIYLFAIILGASIALPTYLSISENVCKLSLVNDLEEEAEDVELLKDIEFRMVAADMVTVNNLFVFLPKKIFFIPKNYNSLIRILDSPPPEFI